ncbi:MAG: hypothetical protein E6H52_20575 [Betaproteobacteria bacterium]|nr:MAG: hypothetical protein E6H52_20575 [Betaproteobacteria bacterium]
MIRRTTSWISRPQSRSHSAHVGQEVQAHYRWHPLFGRRLQNGNGKSVSVRHRHAPRRRRRVPAATGWQDG